MAGYDVYAGWLAMLAEWLCLLCWLALVACLPGYSAYAVWLYCLSWLDMLTPYAHIICWLCFFVYDGCICCNICWLIVIAAFAACVLRLCL
jgi:hypothetical protein